MVPAVERMTIEKAPGMFVFIMKNTNHMEHDEKIMERMARSKVGYCLSRDYLMVKEGQAGKAISELKEWHLI
jgi:hypothetical protein